MAALPYPASKPAYALPKVTIGIPTWNRKDYLQPALASALAQAYPNLEIVVSDNASDDGTSSFLDGISDLRLVILHQSSNVGAIRNLNACLERATGELFLLLSDDDLLEPNTIAKLAEPFHHATPHSSPDEVGLCWCNCRIIDASGEGKWSTRAGPAVEPPLSLLTALFSGERGPRLSSVMIRTADARRVGGYDLERYNAMCDTANWGAACLPYKSIVCVPEPLVAYRVHASSHTGASIAADWQRWGANMHTDLAEAAEPFADVAALKRFARSRNRLLANLTVDILMRGRGTPGWLSRTLRETWRSRQYLLSLYTAKRITLEGWKLLR